MQNACVRPAWKNMASEISEGVFGEFWGSTNQRWEMPPRDRCVYLFRYVINFSIGILLSFAESTQLEELVFD